MFGSIVDRRAPDGNLSNIIVMTVKSRRAGCTNATSKATDQVLPLMKLLLYIALISSYISSTPTTVFLEDQDGSAVEEVETDEATGEAVTVVVVVLVDDEVSVVVVDTDDDEVSVSVVVVEVEGTGVGATTTLVVDVDDEELELFSKYKYLS